MSESDSVPVGDPAMPSPQHAVEATRNNVGRVWYDDWEDNGYLETFSLGHGGEVEAFYVERETQEDNTFTVYHIFLPDHPLAMTDPKDPDYVVAETAMQTEKSYQEQRDYLKDMVANNFLYDLESHVDEHDITFRDQHATLDSFNHKPRDGVAYYRIPDDKDQLPPAFEDLTMDADSFVPGEL